MPPAWIFKFVKQHSEEKEKKNVRIRANQTRALHIVLVQYNMYTLFVRLIRIITAG